MATETHEKEPEAKEQDIAPPPPSPSYGEHLIGNQIRWAAQVLRYTFASHKREDEPENTSTQVH